MKASTKLAISVMLITVEILRFIIVSPEGVAVKMYAPTLTRARSLEVSKLCSFVTSCFADMAVGVKQR